VKNLKFFIILFRFTSNLHFAIYMFDLCGS